MKNTPRVNRYARDVSPTLLRGYIHLKDISIIWMSVGKHWISIFDHLLLFVYNLSSAVIWLTWLCQRRWVPAVYMYLVFISQCDMNDLQVLFKDSIASTIGIIHTISFPCALSSAEDQNCNHHHSKEHLLSCFYLPSASTVNKKQSVHQSYRKDTQHLWSSLSLKLLLHYQKKPLCEHIQSVPANYS